MKRVLYTFIYILSLTLAGLSIHQAFAQQRGPSVEPITEVEIGIAPKSEGYNFAATQQRLPAGIRSKESSSTYAIWGPIIFFLLALPFTLWALIRRKLKITSEDKKTEYYSNVHQFTPYKTEYQKHDVEDDDDDIDYPKSA